MKHLPKLALLLGLPLLIVSCRKQTNSDQVNDPVPGLPLATQIGANTLGFLLNGVPWVPAGNNGTANLSIDFDPGFSNGIFGISAYRFITGSKSSFGIGVDSLNFLTVPFTRRLTPTSIYRAGFSKFDSCILYSHYDSVFSDGILTITKLDRTVRIISGEFNFNLSGLGCDTVFITNGRFDLKF